MPNLILHQKWLKKVGAAKLIAGVLFVVNLMALAQIQP